MIEFIKGIFRIEKQRYSLYGPWILVQLAIFLFFAKLIPMWLRNGAWDTIKQRYSDYQIFVVGLVKMHTIASLALNVGMYFVYSMKIPFLD